MSFNLKLFIYLSSFISTTSYACSLNEIATSGKWKTVKVCEKNRFSRIEEYYIPTSKMTSLKELDLGGRVIKRKTWSVEGILRYSSIIEYYNKHKLVREISVDKRNLGKTRSKELYNLDNVLVKEWIYSKRSLTPRAARYYKVNETKPYRIDVLNSNEEIIKYYLVEFNYKTPTAELVPRFKVFDPSGKLVGNYNEEKSFNVIDHIKSLKLPKNEIDKRLSVFNNKNRIPVVIIDTGFDIYHEMITHKLYNSPVEIYNDGIDNDGNGKVDDSWGWHRQDDYGLDLVRNDRNIRETHTLIHTPYPVSHGTHVAALALKDLDEYGLVGFAGDVAISDQLESAGDYISKNKVKFINMSFALGAPGAAMSAPRESFYYLDNTIQRNLNSLFVVAAGNARASINLDIKGSANYPASYTYKNMIKVGAINSLDLKRESYQSYKKAGFSKFGKKTVQIFAPGQGVVSAQSGGGVIGMNGTSMAAPFVTNVLLKGHLINKKIDIYVLKELLLKTAFVPKGRPFECQSGGVVVPERFYEAVKLFKDVRDINRAIEASRKKITIPGEETSIQALKAIWTERGL